MEGNDDLCQICGRLATAYHYKVLSCGGCKIFFRRTLKRKYLYQCKKAGNCSTDSKSHGKRCKACRFWRCVFLGMEIPGVELPEVVKAARKKFKAAPGDQFQSCVVDYCRLDWQDVRLKSESGSDSECPLDDFQINEDNNSPGNDLDLSTLKDSAVLESSFHCISGSRNVPGIDGFTEKEGSTHYATHNTEFNQNIRAVSQGTCSDLQRLPKWLPMFSDLKNGRSFTPFSRKFSGNLDQNRQQMAVTVQAVGQAVNIIFGDQIQSWKSCRKTAQILLSERVSLDTMRKAVNYHNADSIIRSQMFGMLLPGADELEVSALSTTRAAWKYLVYYLIHHAPVVTDKDVLFTVGPQGTPYDLSCMEQITPKALFVGLFQFCNLVRNIGLTFMESYVLMAVVMFEPNNDDSSPENLQLRILHRHYVDVLLELIKERSSDAEQVAYIGRKLEDFFGILRVINQLYRQNFHASSERRCPQCTLSPEEDIYVETNPSCVRHDCHQECWPEGS